jgi:hypothetical protein
MRILLEAPDRDDRQTFGHWSTRARPNSERKKKENKKEKNAAEFRWAE